MPNCNDQTTLYTDVSLFLKTQFAFNECVDVAFGGGEHRGARARRWSS